MLDGKAKLDFEKFYINLDIPTTDVWENMLLDEFYSMPFSMRFGIYVDWADSVGYEIEIFYDEIITDKLHKYWNVDINKEWKEASCETRSEARNAAIKKLNEIYNKPK